MATLVFDIETVPEDWDAIDSYTKRKLIDSAQEMGETGAKSTLSFSPFTGSILSLALYDIERQQGTVYLVQDTVEAINADKGFVVKTRTEKELLEEFWEGVKSYDVFVTFNGRAFDVPFLLHRSVVHGITPTCTWQQHRYLTKQSFPYHVDLMDECTFYGAMSRRPSLHLLLRAYGIECKQGEMDRTKLTELFHQKQFRNLVDHNVADVIATTALYERWKVHLAPSAFLNAIEF